jgi:hypothetical protein
MTTPDEPRELPCDGDYGDVAVLRRGDGVEPGEESTLGRPCVGESPTKKWFTKNDAETIFERLEAHGKTWKV